MMKINIGAKREVKLGGGNSQAVNDYDKVSLENVDKVDLVFVVQSHIIVPDDGEVQYHGN
jgi:hypothetical protein